MTPLCYARYLHTLRMAYRIRKMGSCSLESTLLNYPEIKGKTPAQVVEIIVPSIRRRLNSMCSGLGDSLLKNSRVRTVELNGQNVFWPIINEQGLEWYGESPLGAFDFLRETEIGLHENARVIYDFGGHHGFWAQYYSMIVGQTGRVYSFEPSIVNIEVSSLLFLLNSAANVVNVAMAIGTSGSSLTDRSKMLVDFVDPNSLEVVDIRNITWDFADFVKMDIEGFEYDVICENPWLFDLARHLHVEVHIPHLIGRGLDYRKIIEKIPFEKFDVFNHSLDNPVYPDTPLEGFCGLLLRRKSS